MHTIPADLLAHMSLSNFARLTEAYLTLRFPSETAARAARAELPTERPALADERPTERLSR